MQAWAEGQFTRPTMEATAMMSIEQQAMIRCRDNIIGWIEGKDDEVAQPTKEPEAQ